MKRKHPTGSGTRASSKASSALLMDEIVRARRQMINDGVTYEPEYYTRRLEPDETEFMKMYLMTIGRPGKKERQRVKTKKVLTAFVGLSRRPTPERVQEHNRMGTDHVDIRTKHGAGQWLLCMVVYLPERLRSYISRKVLRDYWRTTHGPGKIRCGIMLHRYLGLHCSVLSEAESAVEVQIAKVVLPDTEEHDFRPEGVVDVNHDLVVEINKN